MADSTQLQHSPHVRIDNDDFQVEIELDYSAKGHEFAAELDKINTAIAANEEQYEELNSEIDRLTNSADKVDYIVAAASGIIAGLIDSFGVGEFSLDRGKDWDGDKVDSFVVKVAQAK